MQTEQHASGWCLVYADGLSEMVDERGADAAEPVNARALASMKREMNDGSHWMTRGLSGAQVVDSLERPRESLLVEIDDAKRALEDATPALAGRERPRRVRRRGQDFGDEVGNEARYLARDPFCWDRMDRESRPAKIIKIGAHIGGTASVSHEDTVRRGAVALALADWLTGNGYNVEVTAIAASTGVGTPSQHLGCMIPLKRSAEPMDVGSLATALCEMTFYRTVCFISRIARAPFRCNSSLGSTARELPECITSAFDVVVPSTIKGADEASAWLATEIGKLTGEGEG